MSSIIGSKKGRCAKSSAFSFVHILQHFRHVELRKQLSALFLDEYLPTSHLIGWLQARSLATIFFVKFLNGQVQFGFKIWSYHAVKI